jgi:hypothetical protein
MWRWSNGGMQTDENSDKAIPSAGIIGVTGAYQRPWQQVGTA